jgi:hypothetical protein
MRTTVLEGVGQVRLVDVPDPVIEQPSDALVRVSKAAAAQVKELEAELERVRAAVRPSRRERSSLSTGGFTTLGALTA